MRKAKYKGKLGLNKHELWELFIDIPSYPGYVPYMKSVTIHEDLKKNSVWFDVTKILFIPFHIRHRTDIFDHKKNIGFDIDLPLKGKMYQRFHIEEFKDGTLITGEIHFDFKNKLLNSVLGPVLEKKLTKMLEGMFLNAEKIHLSKK